MGPSKPRGLDQFDFSYLGTGKLVTPQLDLAILSMGVHFSYFDPDKWGEILDEFLPHVKRSIKANEYWFMSNNRFCGPCFSAGRGFSKGNKPVYLREVQNEARAEIMR